MAEPIHETKLVYEEHGNAESVSSGYYAVKTDGHIALVAPNSPLTASMRLATAAEVARARQMANPPTEAPPVADAWAPDEGVA